MRLTSFVLTFTLASAALGSVSGAQVPVPSSAPTVRGAEIAVSSVGEAEVTPDRARVSIGVQTQAPTAADAASKNATLQQAIINAVKAIGIPAERITTSGYNVYPDQQYDNVARRSRVVGYNVQNTIVVDVWKMDSVGRVLDVALSKGANLVSSLSLYSSQEEAGRRRALANAVARARADAEAMAEAAGGRLGSLVELTSGVMYQPPRPRMEVAMAAAKVAGDATPISEGTQTLTAQVSARWVFVPGR